MDNFIMWLHLVAIVVWLGGLVFTVVALLPGKQPAADGQGLSPAQFVAAAMRFRPVLWAAMGIVVASGAFRIVQLGGFRALPVVIHIKITVALVMIVLSLVTSLVLLPRVAGGAAGETLNTRAYTGYVIASILVIGLGLLAFWLVGLAGLL